MKRRLIAGLSLMVLVFSACGIENRKGYYFDNHKFNYVRVENFKEGKGKNINHPTQFNEPEISTILKTVMIKKGSFFSKDVEERQIFDNVAASKLAPAIVTAFSTIGPDKKVGFSFLVKSPRFIIRNDRLTEGSMWVEDGKLHIDFDILFVKLLGDQDKRGYSALRRDVANARGLHVELDLGPGQAFGNSTKELVVDMGVASNLAKEVALKAQKDAAAEDSDAVKIKVVKDRSSQERLKELETLKKQKMITEEEFEKKRQEILQQL